MIQPSGPTLGTEINHTCFKETLSKKEPYAEIEAFMQHAKELGISHVKIGNLEFSFHVKPIAHATSPRHNQVVDKAENTYPLTEGMPSDDELLFASVETTEFKDPMKKEG